MYLKLNKKSLKLLAIQVGLCWTSLQSDQNLHKPHVVRQQLSIGICCRRPRSATNPPATAAAVDRRDRQTDCRILYDHYLPTVILIVTLIIIGIPSPTHSLTLGLNPSFSVNPPYPAFPFSPSGFTIWISHTVYCYF